MSRIGIKPVKVPTGVTVEISATQIVAKGPKGELKQELHPKIKVELNDGVLTVSRVDELKESKALHGLFRSLVANMVTGVSQGFQKQIEIVGVGYRASVNKNNIELSIGYSHPVKYSAPKEIEFTQDEKKKNLITISGVDKQVVGQTAAKVRSFRPPEPYKGKGIKYVDEVIIRKAGKAAGSK